MPPKPKKSAEKDADSIILEYLNKQNRPFSVPLLTISLHGSVGKTQIQKSCDSLAASGQLAAREFGKAKIYFRMQDGMEVDKEQLLQMDETINEKKDSIQQLKEECGVLDGAIKTLNSALTDEQIELRIAELSVENENLQSKLLRMKETSGTTSKSEVDDLEKKYNQARNEWRKRKRMYKDVMDALSEGLPIKEIEEDIGIESDESVGVSFDQSRVLKRRKVG